MAGGIWDRHGVLPVGGANRGTDTTFGPGGAGLLTCWTCPSAGQAVEAAPGHPDLGTGTMFGGRQSK